MKACAGRCWLPSAPRRSWWPVRQIWGRHTSGWELRHTTALRPSESTSHRVLRPCRRLAAALRVKHIPSCCLFSDRKQAATVTGLAPAMLQSAVRRLSQPLAQPAAQPAAPNSKATHAATMSAGDGVPVKGVRGVPPTRPGLADSASSFAPAGPWDPPAGQAATAGAERLMQNGRLAVFCPRMPCLQCGCPW